MSRAPIRRPRKKGNRLRCALCGSSDAVQRHHVGGRYHVAWFTMPLCRRHHERVTEAIRLAGIDMRFTPDVWERLWRARQATLIFLWMLGEFERGSARQ